MANYANQKYIEITEVEKIIHKSEKENHNTFILSIDFKYEAAAARRLSGNGFKVWRYLLKWNGVKTKDGYKYYDYSPAAIRKEMGLGKNGPDDAFIELVRKGYLFQPEPDIHPNKYIFRAILPEDYQALQNQWDF